MIPLAAIPWRLIGYGAAVGAVLLLGWRVAEWRSAYKALPGVQDALEREESCEDGSKCFERQRALEVAQAQKSAEVVSEYERELAALRSRPPAPAVRLCRPTSRGPVRVPAATTAADGAAPGGDIPLETSGDIGQRLFDLADEADRESLKLRFLQDWNRSLSSSASEK